VRTSGAGNESLMTVVVLVVALGAIMLLLGGPEEFARTVDRLVHDVVTSGVAMVRSR
jgi:hypothetical protein